MTELSSIQQHDGAALRLDAPLFGEVVFEIGLILAAHLGVAVVVTLLLADCTSC